MDPDLELLDRWCAGDNGAGNDLLQRHFDSVRRFFASRLPRDADELVQATFLACVRSRDQFRRHCSFRTYLFTIARNELYWYFQRRRRDVCANDLDVTPLHAVNTTPRTQLARNQDHDYLLAALRSLPLDQQLLLELHYWEDMTSAELAEVFEVAQVTARTRLYRARAALRTRMQTMEREPVPRHESVEDLDSWARSLREYRAVGVGDKPR